MAGIVDILYVRFRVADLAKQRDFLTDFGFVVEEADGLLLAAARTPTVTSTSLKKAIQRSWA